jgi:hypothetical protein
MRLLRLLLLATALFVALPADASVSIAVGFDALVKDADGVAIVTPAEAKSVWEEGRIITYTKVKIDQGVAGDVGKEAWVRTLGGVVGKIGQLVDGEPVFAPNKQTLLFLHKFTTNGTFEVSARAQGQFPVVVDENTKLRKLMRSGSLGVILPPKEATPAPRLRLAAEVIHDRPVDDAVKEIADAWKKAHAK